MPSFHRVWGGNDLITVDFTWKLDDDHDNDVDNHGDDHYDQTDVDDPSLGGNHSIAIAITWNLYQTSMTAASDQNNYFFQFHLLSLLKFTCSINPSNLFYRTLGKKEKKDKYAWGRWRQYIAWTFSNLTSSWKLSSMNLVMALWWQFRF